ncbi:MAG: hypothetical protein VYC82_08675 [Verrucomicrobiota bacterium]|nr:hypothetical protein [Verrucomicrobiota bacterium]
MSRQLEFRLDPEAVRPLVLHFRSLVDSLKDDLVAENEPPTSDQVMSEVWVEDLLESQRKDIASLNELFDDKFLDTGRATVNEEDVDLVLRGCAALRLVLRDSTLSRFEDERLERGEVEVGKITAEEEIGYSVYILLASLQELIISQLDP